MPQGFCCSWSSAGGYFPWTATQSVTRRWERLKQSRKQWPLPTFSSGGYLLYLQLPWVCVAAPGLWFFSACPQTNNPAPQVHCRPPCTWADSCPQSAPAMNCHVPSQVQQTVCSYWSHRHLPQRRWPQSHPPPVSPQQPLYAGHFRPLRHVRTLGWTACTHMKDNFHTLPFLFSNLHLNLTTIYVCI